VKRYTYCASIPRYQHSQLSVFIAKCSNGQARHGKKSQISTKSWLCRHIEAPDVVTPARECVNCVNVDEEREDSSRWQNMVNNIVNALRSF